MQVRDGKVGNPPDNGSGPVGQTAATSFEAPAATAAAVVPSGAALARAVVTASPVVARLTREGGAPTIRTSRWRPGDSKALEGTAVQLVYRQDVHLVGVMPLVTPTGGTTYRVEKMRVDATARRFLVYVDARSGAPKVVGITAGE
jgi:hypothetical protein